MTIPGRNKCVLTAWERYEQILNTASGSTVVDTKEFRDGLGARVDDNTSTINLTASRVDDNGVLRIRGGTADVDYDLDTQEDFFSIVRSLRYQTHTKDDGSAATEGAPPSGNTWGLTSAQPNAVPDPLDPSAVATTMSEAEFNCTPSTIFIEQKIDGDSNLTAAGFVRYRREGTSEWKHGLRMHRVSNEYGPYRTLLDDDPVTPLNKEFNGLHGSVQNLAPGTSYEIEVTVTDATNGVTGTNPAIYTVKTRPMPVNGTGTVHRVANRSEFDAAYAIAVGGDIIECEPDDRGADASYYTNPAGWTSGVFGSANSNYNESIALNRGGSRDNLLVIRGTTDSVLFPRLSISADWIWVDNIKCQPIVRNAATDTIDIDFDSDWNYKGVTDTAPASGEWSIGTDNQTIRISYTDADSGDQTAALNSVSRGMLRFEGDTNGKQGWNCQESGTDQGTYREWSGGDVDLYDEDGTAIATSERCRIWAGSADTPASPYPAAVEFTGGNYGSEGVYITRWSLDWGKASTWDEASQGEVNAATDSAWHDLCLQGINSGATIVTSPMFMDIDISSDADEFNISTSMDTAGWAIREGIQMRPAEFMLAHYQIANCMDPTSLGGTSGNSGTIGITAGAELFGGLYSQTWDDVIETDHMAWGVVFHEAILGKTRWEGRRPPSHPTWPGVRNGFIGMALWSIGQGGNFAGPFYQFNVQSTGVQIKSNPSSWVKVNESSICLTAAQSQFWCHRGQQESNFWYRNAGQNDAHMFAGNMFGIRNCTRNTNQTFTENLFQDLENATWGGVNVGDGSDGLSMYWDRNAYYGQFNDTNYVGSGTFGGYPGATVAALSTSLAQGNSPAADANSVELVKMDSTIWENPFPIRLDDAAFPQSETDNSVYVAHDYGTLDEMRCKTSSGLYGSGVRDSDYVGAQNVLPPYLNSTDDAGFFTKLSIPSKDARDIGAGDTGMGRMPVGVREHGDYIAWQTPPGWEVRPLNEAGSYTSLGVSPGSGVTRLVLRKTDSSAAVLVEYEEYL